jgi:hypothetical protein
MQPYAAWETAFVALLNEAVGIAQRKPIACVILQRSQQKAKLNLDRDHNWQAFVMRAFASSA